MSEKKRLCRFDKNSLLGKASIGMSPLYVKKKGPQDVVYAVCCYRGAGGSFSRGTSMRGTG